MTSQPNQSDPTHQQSGHDSSQQEGGGQSAGRPVQPGPDTIREIPIGAPMQPAEWERLKREAEKPRPRPSKQDDDPEDGQQDPQQDPGEDT